jgi:hypothetical protein
MDFFMDFGAAEFLANCIDRLPWGHDQKATRHMLFQVYPCLYQTTLTLKFGNHIYWYFLWFRRDFYQSNLSVLFMAWLKNYNWTSSKK